MSDSALTIRNLTSNLLHVEKFEIHQRLGRKQGGNSISNVTKNVTSIFSNSKNPDIICQTTRAIFVELQPTHSCKISVVRPNLPNQILCLYFVIKGQRYQSNVIHARCASQYLMSVDGNPDPPDKHITVYHPEHHHLTIGYRESYRAWMRSLRDDIPLSALSIPVREQLLKGVRFLDIRVQPEHHQIPLRDEMILVHGVFPISLTGPRHFRSLVNEVLKFLSENPSETIIMSVKREGTGPSTDAHLSKILHNHYASDASKWYTAPRIPYLGEARGKIVLIRRFHLDDSLEGEWGGAGWCINGDTWADNSPNSMCPSGDLCIQDFYEVLETQNIAKKIQYSIEHLKRAAECVCPAPGSGTMVAKQPFFINFLTASNFWKMGCWPDKIAAKLNPAIIEYLCLSHNEKDEGGLARGDGSTGIVVCDWVGHQGNWDIVRCIVGMNAKFEKSTVDGTALCA